MTEMTLETVFVQVGLWSRENFGDNKGLNAGAALFGVGEELGELIEALNTMATGGTAAAVDAIGDIGIYMFDFAGRDGVNPAHLQDLFCKRQRFDLGTIAPIDGMVIHYGKLCHCYLKRAQGIRGYDNPEQYKAERDESISKFMGYLTQMAAIRGGVDKIIIKTWVEIVSKRNWKPATA